MITAGRFKAARTQGKASAQSPLSSIIVAALALFSVPAFATNGYFLHGYGNGSKAMGGVGFALGQDALASATNPALLTTLGDRVDFGLELFKPYRDADIVGNHFSVGTPYSTLVPVLSADGHYNGDSRQNFYLPEAGVVRRLTEAVTAGIAVYGNGGLDTDFAQNPYSAFQLQGQKTNAGVDLQQLFFTAALSARLGPYLSFGVAPTLVYQRAKVFGLQAFATKGINVPGTAVNVPGLIGPFSDDPDHVTNNGYSGSFGLGYRLGVAISPFQGLTFGLGGQPRIHMQRFAKYAGLLAGHGAFDVPTNYGGGLAYGWHDLFTISSDIQRILFHSVASIGDGIQPLVDGVKLGADGGPGFGWRNVTVYKFGGAVRVLPNLLLRGGYSYCRQPVPQDQTLFNILTPGVGSKHYTAGALIDLGNGYELSAYYLLLPGTHVYGHDSIPPNHLLSPLPPASFGGGETNLHGTERSLAVSLAIHF